MGHSEGGIIAPLAASKYEGIAFIICMAGTGVRGMDVIREQSKLIGNVDNAKDEDIKINDEMLAIIDKINSDTTNKTYKAELKNKLHEAYEKMSREEKERFVSEKVFMKLSVSTFETPWMKYFLSYDPYPALTKVKCPVLLLFGGKDLQVSVNQSEGPMVKALQEGGNTDYTVKTFPDANHLFQTASTGSPMEYSVLPKEFTPGFLETVTEWILKRVTIVK
jgi:pimeloyl-ACP methyl ester carboxylesterase